MTDTIQKSNHKTIGVIDVGGGQRAVYGAGVFDRLLDLGITFDRTYGISAGSANVTSFLAGQKGRNVTYYTEYCLRPEYSSPKVFLKTGSIIDLRYIYGTLSNSDGEYPLDFPVLMDSPASCTVIATDAVSGKPVYFDKSDLSQDHYEVIMASCSVPVFCKAFTFNGTAYYDGAISDPIPLKRAFDDGCDAVVLILTRPADYYRTDTSDRRLSHLMPRRYKGAKRAFVRRAITYNNALRWAHKLQDEGKVLIVAPDNIDGIKTFGKHPEASKRLYDMGVHDADAIPAFVNNIRSQAK